MLNGLLQLLTAGLVSLGLASLLLWLNPAVMLAVALLVASGYGLVIVLSRRPLQRLGPAIKRDQTQRIRILQEGLGAIRDVILDGHQPAYTALYGRADRRLRQQRGQAQFLALAPRYGMEAIGLVAIALAATVLVAGAPVCWGVAAVGGPCAGCPAAAAALQMIYAAGTLSPEPAGLGVGAGLSGAACGPG